MGCHTGRVVLAEAFSFQGVVLERDGHRILDGVSDHIHKASTTAVIGASGSGKSTFLRLLNRFEEPTRGSIRLPTAADVEFRSRMPAAAGPETFTCF